MGKTLVIVPCGKEKIWDGEPGRGATPAREAYTSAFFRTNRGYAEHFGEAWMVLSAKYGFVRPFDLLPETYDVTFNRKGPGLVSGERLREQVRELGLDGYGTVVCLGGAGYRRAAGEAFAPFGIEIVAPFAGLKIGAMQGATKRAVTTGEPFPDRW